MNLVDYNTGDSLTAAQFNSLKNESQNAILGGGIALSSGDNTQVAQSLSQHVADASFYTTGGTANAITLSAQSPRLKPPGFFNGFKARFRAAATNTSTVTINVATLGAKAIKKQGLSETLIAGDIEINKFYETIYNLANDNFELIKISDSGNTLFNLDFFNNQFFEREENIVFYGDSNTRFFQDVDQSVNSSYPNLLRQYILENLGFWDYTTKNMGVSGRTAAVAAETANINLVLAENPTTVFIGFGTNDIKVASPDIDAYITNMTTIIDTLQAAGVKVVISTILDFDNNYGANGAASRALIPVWNEQLKILGIEKQALVFDWNKLCGLADAADTLFTDPTGDLRHIGQKGQILTAKAIKNLILNNTQAGDQFQGKFFKWKYTNLLGSGWTSTEFTLGQRTYDTINNAVKDNIISISSPSNNMALLFYSRTNSGKADIYINGVFNETIDTYKPLYYSEFEPYQILWSNQQLNVDDKITIRVRGDKNASSSDTIIYFIGFIATLDTMKFNTQYENIKVSRGGRRDIYLDYKPVALATTVNADSSIGQKILNVTDETGFNVDDWIIINSGGIRQEVAKIDSIAAGTLTLIEDLLFTHTLIDADAVDRLNIFTSENDIIHILDGAINSPFIESYICTLAGYSGTLLPLNQRIKKDTTGNRPTLTSNDIGYQYLDTTLDADGLPIWWQGTKWIDATGADA